MKEEFNGQEGLLGDEVCRDLIVRFPGSRTEEGLRSAVIKKTSLSKGNCAAHADEVRLWKQWNLHQHVGGRVHHRDFSRVGYWSTQAIDKRLRNLWLVSGIARIKRS